MREYMSKQMKILSVLLIIAVLLVLYLIITAKPIARIQEKGDTQAPFNSLQAEDEIDLERLAKDYQEKVQMIFADFLLLAQDLEGTSVNQVESIKNQLLELRVPTQFKDLHLDLVLTINKMEEFLLNGNSEDKFFSQEMIEKIKESYDWLK
jgi:hypothetical protein